MIYLIYQVYNDEPFTVFTSFSVVTEKTFEKPSGTGLWNFDIRHSATGAHLLSLINPDGVESTLGNWTSLATVSYVLAERITTAYVGVGTTWTVRIRQYQDVIYNPLPLARIDSIIAINPEATALGSEVNTSIASFTLLEPGWGTFETGERVGAFIDGGNTPPEPDPDPTSTNLVSGNVKKLNLPFEANVVAVSIGLDPVVLAETKSDPITGDYTLDVYPHTDNVLIYVAPDYGVNFIPGFIMATGQIIHPTIPNKYVYIAQNDGALSLTEPNWVTEGSITVGGVLLIPTPLYRPLMNGFIKPVIVPI